MISFAFLVGKLRTAEIRPLNWLPSHRTLCRFPPPPCLLICEDRSFQVMPELWSWVPRSLEPCSIPFFSSLSFLPAYFLRTFPVIFLLCFWLKRKKKRPFEKSSIFSASFPLIWFDILPPPLWKALLWNSYWLSHHQPRWPLRPEAQQTLTHLRGTLLLAPRSVLHFKTIVCLCIFMFCFWIFSRI